MQIKKVDYLLAVQWHIECNRETHQVHSHGMKNRDESMVLKTPRAMEATNICLFRWLNEFLSSRVDNACLIHEA